MQAISSPKYLKNSSYVSPMMNAKKVFDTPKPIRKKQSAFK